MSDDNDVRPLLMEIRDIVLRHEEVNRKDSEFRRRVLFVLLLALVAAVAAMCYGLMLVHGTIKEIKQRQEQLQPQKIADSKAALKQGTPKDPVRGLAGKKIQPRMKHGSNADQMNNSPRRTDFPLRLCAFA